MSYILKVKIYIQNTGQKCYFFNCLLVTDMTAAVAINVSLYSTRAFRLNCCILCKRDELLHMICRINSHEFYGALCGSSSSDQRRYAAGDRAFQRLHDLRFCNHQASTE